MNDQLPTQESARIHAENRSTYGIGKMYHAMCRTGGHGPGPGSPVDEGRWPGRSQTTAQTCGYQESVRFLLTFPIVLRLKSRPRGRTGFGSPTSLAYALQQGLLHRLVTDLLSPSNRWVGNVFNNGYRSRIALAIRVDP